MAASRTLDHSVTQKWWSEGGLKRYVMGTVVKRVGAGA